MEFLKKSIHMDQIGCEEQTQITLEDDVNIADTKPDVYQVVKGRAAFQGALSRR